MEHLLLNLCAYLLLWWFLWLPLAESLAAAISAFFAEILLVVGRVLLVLVVLAWGICCIVVLARRVR